MHPRAVLGSGIATSHGIHSKGGVLIAGYGGQSGKEGTENQDSLKMGPEGS
jgi:hypothetical protein